MPTRIATNWENAFLRFGSDPPIKIEDVICYTDEPEEELKYTEDEVYVGIDLSSSATYSFDVQLDRKQYKRITSFVRRGNNWRRMHGKKMIRIPLKERRKHE